VNDTPAASAGAPSARLRIDLGALAANYRALQRIAGPSEVAGVVKANAYGLGVGAVANCLAAAGCHSFFVSTLAEGLELRALEPGVRVFVLEGTAGEPGLCRVAGLVPVLNTVAEVREWVAAGGAAPAALQLDTGMARAGLDAGGVAALAADPQLLAALGPALVMTHLACADEPHHPLNRLQIERFAALRAALPPAPTSIGNSAGTLLGPEFRGDLVRPGIALYGGRPLAAGANPMREVVRLEARVLQLREVAAGTTVGYGAGWVAPAAARIATIGAGYADGYPRALGNRGYAFAAGQRLPVVGRVSMDLTTLDVASLPVGALGVGDYVDLLGGGVPLEDAAERAGTISYEILARLSTRLARVYRPVPP
jgi:alanine racemase